MVLAERAVQVAKGVLVFPNVVKKEDIYAFFFGQKGLMAGLGL